MAVGAHLRSRLADAAADPPGWVIKRFDTPDEVRTFEKGRLEIVRIGAMTVGRASYEPGWKWSRHVGPTVGTRAAASSTSAWCCPGPPPWPSRTAGSSS